MAGRPQQRRRSRLGAHQDGRPRRPGRRVLGRLTQEWLATSDDAEALTSGGYWHHQRRETAHRPAYDQQLQDELLEHLARITGERLA